MVKTKELSNDMRQITKLHKDGKGCCKMAQNLNLLVCKVGAVIQKWKNYYTTENIQTSGHPHKLNKATEQYIAQNVKKQPFLT